MKTERVISWFDKETEILQGEFKLDSIPLDELKKIFQPPKTDPLMYEPYTISEIHIKSLKEIIDFDFDFNNYLYQIDCFQT